MSHVRKQIRDRVATLLAPVGTVYTSRMHRLPELSLPALLVFTNDEEIEAADFTKAQRGLQVVVEVVAQATANLDDDLDALVAGVEAAIGADPRLNGLALQCALAAINVTMSVEGSAPIGRARMTYQTIYRTAYSDPETAL